jgi:hypothetical protein
MRSIADHPDVTSRLLGSTGIGACPAARHLSGNEDAVPSLAKYLRTDGVLRRGEIMVEKVLIGDSERCGFEGMVSAAGADDERCRIAHGERL